MAGRNMFLPFIGAKHLTNKVGVFDSDIEQGTFACCAIVGNRSFVQMTAIIKFVAVDFLPTMRSPPAGKAVTLISYACSEVSVRFLGSGNKIYDTVQISIQCFIILHSQRVGSSFYYLIRIGIVKREITTVFTFHQSSGNGKIIEASVLLTFFKCRRNGDGAIGFNTRSPEVIVQVDLCERDFFYRSIRLNVGFAASNHTQEGDATEKELDSFLHNIIYVFLVRYQKCTAKEKDLS